MSIQITLTPEEEFRQQYQVRVFVDLECRDRSGNTQRGIVKTMRLYEGVRLDGVDYALDYGWAIGAQIPRCLAAPDARLVGNALLAAAEWIEANP